MIYSRVGGDRLEKKIAKINRRKIVSVRLPERLLNDLKKITHFNNTSRTTEIERYILEGMEKSKRILEKKYVAYGIMILTLTSIGLYFWYLFNV